MPEEHIREVPMEERIDSEGKVIVHVQSGTTRIQETPRSEYKQTELETALKREEGLFHLLHDAYIRAASDATITPYTEEIDKQLRDEAKRLVVWEQKNALPPDQLIQERAQALYKEHAHRATVLQKIHQAETELKSVFASKDLQINIPTEINPLKKLWNRLTKN